MKDRRRKDRRGTQRRRTYFAIAVQDRMPANEFWRRIADMYKKHGYLGGGAMERDGDLSQR